MLLSPSIAILRAQPDERLVEFARDGSEPAFAALMERHRRVVLRACRRILPEARAEDATQQVFLAAWKGLRRGDDVREPRAWLLRIARNTSLNALRNPGYDYDELKESLRVSEAPEAELERRDVVRRTLRGLAELPERQREALLRSAVEGIAHADLARDMGLSEGATRQLVLRARATLRSAAGALTPTPLISWAASSASRGGPGSGDLLPRIGELAAGGGAGVGAVAAKVGVVAVVATSAVAGPAVVHKATHRDGGRSESRQADKASAARTIATARILRTAALVSPGSASTSAAGGAPAFAGTGHATAPDREGSAGHGRRGGRSGERDRRPAGGERQRGGWRAAAPEPGAAPLPESGSDSGQGLSPGTGSGTGSGGSGSGSSGAGSGTSGGNDAGSGSGGGHGQDDQPSSAGGEDSGSHGADDPAGDDSVHHSANDGSGQGDEQGSSGNGGTSSGSGSGGSGSASGGSQSDDGPDDSHGAVASPTPQAQASATPSSGDEGDDGDEGPGGGDGGHDDNSGHGGGDDGQGGGDGHGGGGGGGD